MSQRGNPIFDALVWSVADGVAGLDHDRSHLGDVGPPEQYPTIAEHLARTGDESSPPYPFWNNFESRPLIWIDNWEEREPGEPVWESWERYIVEPDPGDLYLCAARLLVLVDVGSWPGVTRLHVDTKGLYAPSTSRSSSIASRRARLRCSCGASLLRVPTGCSVRTSRSGRAIVSSSRPASANSSAVRFDASDASVRRSGTCGIRARPAGHSEGGVLLRSGSTGLMRPTAFPSGSSMMA